MSKFIDKICDIVKRVLNNNYTIVFYFAIVSLVMLLYGLHFATYNWDILAYVGSAKNFTIDDKESLHNYVYSEALTSIPEENLYIILGDVSPGKYITEDYSPDEDKLPNDDYYRQVVSLDPEAFYQQLPFYQIKILYVALIYTASELGVNPFRAAHIITIISLIMGLWILLFAFKPYINTYLIYTIPILAFAFGILKVSKLATPDGLAFLTLSLMAYLFIRMNRLILILIPLSILVRTDLIIYAVIILVYLGVHKRHWRYQVLASAGASVLCYYLVNSYFGNYGWVTLFHFAFIEFLPYPADADIHFNIIEYLSVLPQSIGGMITNGPFLTYAAITILNLYLLSKYGLRELISKPLPLQMLYIAFASFVFIILHFLLFPAIEARFFFGHYLLSTGVFLYLLSSEEFRVDDKS